MPRMKSVSATSATPVVIHPGSVWTVPQIRATFGLTKSTVGREVRLGRLRVSRRAGKYLILGAWLLQ